VKDKPTTAGHNMQVTQSQIEEIERQHKNKRPEAISISIQQA